MLLQNSTLLSKMRGSALLGGIRRLALAGVVLFASSHAWAFQASARGALHRPHPHPQPSGPTHAPEINPALIVGVLVLVVGGLLILTSRRRAASGSKS